MPHRLANDEGPISLRSQKEDALFQRRALSGRPERKGRSTAARRCRLIPSPCESIRRNAAFSCGRVARENVSRENISTPRRRAFAVLVPCALPFENKDFPQAAREEGCA